MSARDQTKGVKMDKAYGVSFLNGGHWNTSYFDILTDAENRYMELFHECNANGYLLQLIDYKRKKLLATNAED